MNSQEKSKDDLLRELQELQKKYNTLKESHIGNILEIESSNVELKKSQLLLNETGKMAKVGGWEFNIKTQELQWTNEVYNIHELDLSFTPTIEKAINFYSPESKSIIEKAVQRAIDYGEPFDLELEIITDKKNRLFIHALGKANITANKVTSISGTFQDITEWKKIEKSLKESEEKYRDMVNNTLVGVYISKLNGEILFVNDYIVKALDYGSTGKLLSLNSVTVYKDQKQREILIQQLKENFCVIGFEFIALTNHMQEKIFLLNARLKNDIIEGTLIDITERKQITDKLAKSEKEFKVLFECAHDGIFILEKDGRYTDANSAALKMTGYTKEELYKLSFKDLSVPGENEMPLNIDDLKTKNSIIRKRTIRAKDGKLIPVETSITLLPDGKLLGITRNITEQKLVEKALKESYDLLSNLTAQVPGVVYQYRLFPDGRSCFPYSSPGINDIYEHSPDDVREDATPVFKRIHPDDYDYIVKSIKESARTLQPYHSEFRVVLPRQGLRWRLCDAQPERLTDGSTLWHGIISDITERKQAEELLNRTNEKVKLILDVAGEGILGIDINGYITFANPMALKLLGYEAEELTGKHSHSLFHHSHPDRSPFPMEECPNYLTIKDGKYYKGEDYYWKKDGTSFYVEYSSAPVKENGIITGTVITFIDITERKEVEEAIKAKSNELERFNNLMVNREIKMIDLKKEINELMIKSGKQEKYKIKDQVN